MTPALGQRAADGVLTAVRAARAAGAKVSFDGNFRPKLWEAWGGDAPTILRALMAEADLLFASHRDLQVVLGLEFPQATPQERFAAGAAEAFRAFPHLRQMAATVRVQRSVDHHVISGITALRDGALHTTAARDVSPIVDRIGTGDAFAAGVLHGGLTGLSAQEALNFGVAAACLKHSLPGDFNLVGANDVRALLGENALDVKR